MKLMIVESPNKRKTIKSFLGDEWQVEASVGHIADLPQKELGMDENFMPNYCLSENGQKVVKKLKPLAEKADEVWLASDPDREGEAIAAHLSQFLKLKSPKRITFNEITKEAVREAVAAPRGIDQNLYDAQQARRVIDRLFGYKVSPVLSDLANEKLSAGRVQSIAVRLLAEKERAIQNFKSTSHFGVKISLVGGCQANWIRKAFLKDEQLYILDGSLAKAVAETKEVMVGAVSEKVQTINAPAPFITTTLQKAASIHLDLNPTQAMAAAQKLFELGLITYHRTDSPNVSEASFAKISAALNAMDFSEHVVSTINTWSAKKSAQGAHEAIRPTDFSKSTAEGTEPSVGSLYQLIRARALASQMKACQIQVKTILLRSRVPDQIEDKEVIFEARSQTTLYKGWKNLVEQDQSEENTTPDPKELENLPEVKEGDCLAVENGEVLALKTSAPKRYTEPALISKLEKEGIGRPSTYANILKNILDRGYVKLKQKSFHADKSAFLIFDSLKDKFDFMALEYTKNMESELDCIAEGNLDYLSFVKSVSEKLATNLDSIKCNIKSKYPCPECGAPLRRIATKKKTFFWGCIRFSEGCKAAFHDHKNAPLLPNTKPEHPCPDCGNHLIRREGKYGFFWGCLGFKSGCKTMLKDDKGVPAK